LGQATAKTTEKIKVKHKTPFASVTIEQRDHGSKNRVSLLTLKFNRTHPHPPNIMLFETAAKPHFEIYNPAIFPLHTATDATNYLL